MSRQNLAVPLMGAAALLGGGVYYARKPSNTSGDASQQIANADKPRPTSDETATENRKRAADAKRDNGLGGAGVGTNNATGGAELSTGNRSGSSANHDAPKGPSEKFPSDAGEVGGGHGRGNSNTRAIETHGPSMSSGSSTVTGALGGGGSDTAGSSNSSGIGSKLQGFFGTGGSQDGEKKRQAPVDTKIASHHADTPTNKGGSPWDKHRKDVTAVSSTES
ncbi:hypothetical protein ColTof4_08472 [Colletotrichum tofieldiae]|uniref:Uncharacterized protein n=1 Tax=Colletotrichum tofieldiae TaxID=708197 RepID=A0A166WCE3_9PEZI|nr:hypothetical protein CT0861_06986 [Colletotrichum tofieldiae]GKT54665.1 hypothetical protein ColTof3_02004 [Colletotrichum tofieldiae]GKT76049.1 hypothetical protein ColTof4_08472 [Colletotrichum tofieldiae]GKT83774.1 hypothetical protein Ct61P_01624 [Colletotrichum tofieldiae]